MIPDKLPKVRTIKYIKQVLANYEGICVKDEDGGYIVSCLEQGVQDYFADRKELLAWATFYFWNRDMQPAELSR